MTYFKTIKTFQVLHLDKVSKIVLRMSMVFVPVKIWATGFVENDANYTES